MYQCLFKRLMGMMLAFVILFVIWPFLLFVIIILWRANKGAGVFFTQERPGRNSKL